MRTTRFELATLQVCVHPSTLPPKCKYLSLSVQFICYFKNYAYLCWGDGRHVPTMACLFTWIQVHVGGHVSHGTTCHDGGKCRQWLAGVGFHSDATGEMSPVMGVVTGDVAVTWRIGWWVGGGEGVAVVWGHDAYGVESPCPHAHEMHMGRLLPL